MANLTPSQIRLLRELDFYGGVLIIRTRTNEADYAVLEKDGLFTAFSLGISQVKYKITKAGRAALSTQRQRFAPNLLSAKLLWYIHRAIRIKKMMREAAP